jgi:phosphoglycolate phosphatase-like HAD superfamily hydrolase
MSAVAIDLAALGNPAPLWNDWLEDARRRFRVDGNDLDRELPNWRQLLERYAEERAPVYFRRDADVSTTLRRLQTAGTLIGIFTDAPEELARIALSHLGAERRVDALETGAGARERVLQRLGGAPTVVNTRAELLAVT